MKITWEFIYNDKNEKKFNLINKDKKYPTKDQFQFKEFVNLLRI